MALRARIAIQTTAQAATTAAGSIWMTLGATTAPIAAALITDALVAMVIALRDAPIHAAPPFDVDSSELS
jgi:hypothetical protein